MTLGQVLAVLALICGLLVVIGIAVGPLDPIALAGLGLILLAIAVLIP